MRLSPATLRPYRRATFALMSAALAAVTPALAQSASQTSSQQYHGQVTFNAQALPGATITITDAGKTYTTVTDRQGYYFFADLPAGTATLGVDMFCFAPLKQDITITSDSTPPALELKLLPLDQIHAELQHPTPPPPAPSPTLQPREAAKANIPAVAEKGPEPTSEELQARSADGLLINGSVMNAATSKYSLSPAFGNSRPGAGGLYNGSIGFQEENSTFDARPYSLAGLQTPKPTYNRFSAAFNVGGPIRLRHRRFTHEPTFYALYYFVRNRNDSDASALVPDLQQRMGNFSGETLNGAPVIIYNPATGQPFANDTVPTISPVAQALLALYPLPNIANNSRYNYQVPLLSTQNSDSAQLHINQPLDPKNQVYGDFGLQSLRATNPNLFGFVDTTSSLGLNTNITYSHRFDQRLSTYATYRFSRYAARITPYFENTTNISGQAGVTGNSMSPMDWGPPTLDFTSGIVPLTDAVAVHNRNQTDAVALSAQYNRRRHNITLGTDFRRQQFNYLQQANPRGTFNFTGTATAAPGSTSGTGSDFADFLIGTPDTAAVNFGNADKYFRQNTYDAYLTDDFRVSSTFTLNAGMRWEYGSPITELKNRLVNLDQIGNFAAVAQVLASNPTGPLSGQRFPTSILRPDRADFEPRVGLSWRPIPGSSVVVRAGYGVYADSSVYQSTYFQLAQQAPLSKSLDVQNSASCPLTLANGFHTCGSTIPNTFAADPNFRVGYAQTWNLSVQRDLPASLQATATYLGVKGTRGNQEFLPNTTPAGLPANTALPIGFTYLTSNGNSTRESGSIQLRRRLRAGFTASLLYTYSKSIDDDASLGGQGPVASGLTASSASPNGLAIAQDWRNLAGERGLSTFDQRHLLNATAQYTSGQGLGGGALLAGWRGRLLKEWTVSTAIVAGSGLPENPIYPLAVPGTGFVGSLRPNLTGANLYAAPSGFHLNAAAFAAPAAGQYGNARRNSIEGPDQFTFNSSLARTFRYKKRYSLDLRVDATNLLNHVTYTSYVTTILNSQFGLPVAANPMRSLQTNLRLRF